MINSEPPDAGVPAKVDDPAAGMTDHRDDQCANCGHERQEHQDGRCFFDVNDDNDDGLYWPECDCRSFAIIGGQM